MAGVSAQYIADKLGENVRNVYRKIEQGVIPKLDDGYDLEAAYENEIATLREKLKDPRIALTIAQTRLTEAKAGREELQLEKDKGDLISITEVQESIGYGLEAIRSQFVSLPNVCSVRLSGMENTRDIENYLSDLIDQRLAELENRFENSYGYNGHRENN
jgi:phage terminase Nu1 subunit (DNA packaging protein)